MLQLPAAIKVMVTPLAVHVAGVCEIKVTGSPELALAVGTNGAAPRVWAGIAGKVIVWLSSSAGEIRKVWVTGAAAA